MYELCSKRFANALQRQYEHLRWSVRRSNAYGNAVIAAIPMYESIILEVTINKRSPSSSPSFPERLTVQGVTELSPHERTVKCPSTKLVSTFVLLGEKKTYRRAKINSRLPRKIFYVAGTLLTMLLI